MESTVPEPQPVAPVAEVAREPAATAADDVLLADCRAPPLSFPSCSGHSYRCSDKLLTGCLWTGEARARAPAPAPVVVPETPAAPAAEATSPVPRVKVHSSHLCFHSACALSGPQAWNAWRIVTSI